MIKIKANSIFGNQYVLIKLAKPCPKMAESTIPINCVDEYNGKTVEMACFLPPCFIKIGNGHRYHWKNAWRKNA